MDGRYFTITGSGVGSENGGRYAAKDNLTATAAKKAGARLFRDMSEAQIKAREAKNIHKIKFILQETTRGSRKKTYAFHVKRIKLKNPTVVTIRVRGKAPVNISHKYNYEVARCNP
jgi:O-phosphoseryl-tRNA(Cys) synthetase